MNSIDFDNIKDMAKDLAQAGVAKACEFTDAAIEKGRQLAEIARLKLRNTTEREHMKKAYLALGKLYYEEHGADPEPPYAELCDKVTAAQARIDYNNERIADLKAAGNLTDEEVENASCQDEDEVPSEDTPADDAPQE